MRTLIRPGMVLPLACGVLALLWSASFRYPIVSDTAGYALLGESVWQSGSYSLLGVPHARHMPLHAILSYPLVAAFGYGAGMNLSTLFAGFAVILLSYALLRRAFSEPVALLAAALLPFHHGFVFMASAGSADLLFTALFLAALTAYLRAKNDERFYLLAGVLTGLACLTRYNGAPLFLLFLLHASLERRASLRSGWFWAGGLLGAALFSLWFLRNTLTLGGPFVSEYGGYLAGRQVDFTAQFFSNILYYANPAQNLLPVLAAFAVYGLICCRNSSTRFLLLSLGAAWLLTSVWPVQAMRFAFPGYPILFGFAAAGLLHLWQRFPRRRTAVFACIGFLLAATHIGALCLYSLGSCNAWFDRTVGLVPANLGLSTEGLQSWHEAREFIDAHAEPGSLVLVDSPVHARVWKRGVFRDNLRVSDARGGACPVYRITGESAAGDDVLFSTPNSPVLHVARDACP